MQAFQSGKVRPKNPQPQTRGVATVLGLVASGPRPESA